MQRILAWKQAVSEAKLSVYAANAAFFLLLSLFPALALLLGLIGQLSFSWEDFFSFFANLIPPALIPLFQEAIANLYIGSTPLLSLSALTGLWSASRGIYGLAQGLCKISHIDPPSYVRLRLLAIVYTLAFLFALIFTFAIYALGRWALLLLQSSQTPFVHILKYLLRGRVGFSFLFLCALFLLIYRTFPPGKKRFRQVLPGSLLAAGGWVLFSWLFSIWAAFFSSYSRIYGSVAVVAMTMLWLYFCLEIVLLGALLNEKSRK